MRRVLLLIFLIATLGQPTPQAKTKQTIFIFHTDEFWLNLHHFLYVLGRAENKTRDSSRSAVVNAPGDEEHGLAKLTEAERAIWREAVSFYAKDLSKKDAIFDEPLPAITNALAQAGDAKSLAAAKVDPAVASALERAAPIYHKSWWPAHHAANIEWQRTIQKLVDQHGAAILSFITKVYQLDWNPAGFHVHLSGYTNWAGAYSTTGELLVLSSLAEDIKGNYGLETIFHEGMHQWDERVFEALRNEARKQKKPVPNGLSHAMIFFTAGEAVRHIYPEHVPYAEKFGVWQRGIASFKTPLEEVWKPYVEGRGTRDEALAELVKRTPPIDFSELDTLVPEELKEKNTPGAVITVISGDQVVYQKAFGVANVETNAPMQPEMLFRLGSTTKMFTAAALLTLAEQNKIKMNEPIANRVKGLNGRVGQVTPHYLLSNAAGVRDFAAPVISSDDPALANMVHSWKDDIFFADQGEIYSYSSPGFWLSGFVVEELYGKPYADAMNELLFKPIGMERTTLRPFMAITYPFAIGHAVENGKPTILRPLFNNVAMWPAGSIWSNSKDLSRWVVALMNDGKVDGKQVLSTSLINQMVQHHVPVPGETDSYYGYGLTIFKYKDYEFVAHGGFSRGYGSMIQMVPARKFAVIVLTNKSGETMRKTLNKATQIALGLKDEAPEKPAPVTPATAAEMSEYTGVYSHAPNTWDVSLKDGKLYMKFDGKESVMTKSGERKFTFGQQNENEVVFVPGKSGKIEFLFSELYGAKKK